MRMLMSYQRSDLGFSGNVCRGPSAVRKILGLQAVMAPWPDIPSGPPQVPYLFFLSTWDTLGKYTPLWQSPTCERRQKAPYVMAA